MAHNIMNSEKFAYRGQLPWHKLGMRLDADESIIEAARTMPMVDIYDRPAGYQGSTEWYPIPDHRVLVAHDPKTAAHTPIGIVTPRYHLYTHWDALYSFDKSVHGAPVETLGVLGNGAIMFATYTLPGIDIRGDKVKNYLLMRNPCTGHESINARTTSVRAVCANTLSMALHQKTEHSINVSHRTNPKLVLEEWLTNVWDTQYTTLDLLTEAYTALADTRIAPRYDIVSDLVKQLYPTTPRPPTTNLDILVNWQRQEQRELQRQTDVLTIIETTPNHTEATRNTLWGLYNGIVEYEDYAKAKVTPESMLFGASAKRKQQAFDYCINLAD